MWVRSTLCIHKTARCWRESDLLILCRRAYTGTSPIASTVLSQPGSGRINTFMWSAQIWLLWQGPQNYPCSQQKAQPWWWRWAILTWYLKCIVATVNHSSSDPKDCANDMLFSEIISPCLQSTEKVRRLDFFKGYCKSKKNQIWGPTELVVNFK